MRRWMPDIFRRISIMPRRRNARFRRLYFNSPNCAYSMTPLFPFSDSIKSDIFGGILASICARSGRISAAWISKPSIRAAASAFFRSLLFFSRERLSSVLRRKRCVLPAIPFHLRPAIDAIQPPNALVLRFLMRLANRAFLYAKGVFPRLSLHAPPNPMPGMRALYDKDLTGSDKRRAGQVVLSISVISRFARAAGGTGTAAGFTRETVGEPRSG